MPKDTITFVLNGEIPLADYAIAIGHLSAMIDALTQEVARDAEIDWEIAQLKSSSPTTIIRGISPSVYEVERVVQAYETTGRAMVEHRPIPYSHIVVREATAITSILDGKVKSVEFLTDDYQALVDKALVEGVPSDKNFTWGTVTGYVETLSKHGRLRLVLYDLLFNRSVTCYVNDNRLKRQMLDSWEKRVTVSGKVFRDPETGRPYEVQDITQIKIHEDVPLGSFQAAQGVLPWQNGDELPEDIIRRARDAE